MIPVYEPSVGDDEIKAVVAALQRGEISGSFGESIPAFEAEFASYCGVKHGVAVSSGTAALHAAVAALELEPGSEVLVSASTNIATALAAYHNQLVAVPVDSDPITWNLDVSLIENLITERTRAIIPVHLFGHPVDMDALREVAERHSLVVIEDCAESHGARCRGRTTGSFGDMACFSFYANKVITTGEGGMIVTDDDRLADRLRLLRNLAFGRPRFWHEIPAYNYRMTGFQAAMGRVQLGKIESILADKRRVASLYTRHLSSIDGITLPPDEDWAENVYWMYAIVVDDSLPVSRDDLAAALLKSGIDTRTFFCPMNQQPFLVAQPGHRSVPCPVADHLWRAGMYLPSTPTLDEPTISRIASTLRSVIERSRN